MRLISDAPRPDALAPRQIESLSYALAALPSGRISVPALLMATALIPAKTLRGRQTHRAAGAAPIVGR